MAKNSSLNAAKDAKNDEFYTRYEDIQAELNHYEEHFKNKTVLCNCDDPFESNFCKFFLKNFNYLGLKRLICTSYTSSPVVGTQMTIFDYLDEPVKRGHGYVMDITEVPMANGRGVSDDDIEKLLTSKKRGVKKLEGEGDFRSAECVEYLKQADIVVTNPPFSLFRDYINSLMEYDKKFLIIGNQNALHYKEIFPLIQNDKFWIGYNHVKEFLKPDGTTQKFGNVLWYTNLDITKRHEELIMYRKYNEDEYIKYINYDAIDVGKVAEIPMDYYGNMGVPDSFLEKYNPDQFEIIGLAESELGKSIGMSANLSDDEKDALFKENKSFRAGNPIYRDQNGKLHKPFSRIIIRRKESDNED